MHYCLQTILLVACVSTEQRYILVSRRSRRQLQRYHASLNYTAIFSSVDSRHFPD